MLIPALRELREDIQVTNKSVKELREELEAIATAAKQTRDWVDSVQTAAHEDRRAVTDLRNQLERLTEKMTDMEDRSRRNNVWLVGLPEGAEGSNAAGFLRVNLSKWIPLKGHDIEIDRAHRVYEFRLSSESGGFCQLPVSAEDVCRGSMGGQWENSGHYLSCPAGGAWWPGWRRS